jgi:hypothetical protein
MSVDRALPLPPVAPATAGSADPAPDATPATGDAACPRRRRGRSIRPRRLPPALLPIALGTWLLACGGCANVRQDVGRAPSPGTLPRTGVTGRESAATVQALQLSYQRGMEHISRLEYAPAAREFGAILQVLRTQRLDAEAAMAGRGGNVVLVLPPEREAEATFWLGYCFEKLGRPDLAAGYYRQVTRSFPTTRQADQAEARLQQLNP